MSCCQSGVKVMKKTDLYRAKLRQLPDWDVYLRQESGLPGPRGNIELAQAVADEGDERLFYRYLAFTADQAPTNSPDEFLAICGVVGLGRLLAEGDRAVLKPLRHLASDPRWRIREGVAMALQRWGDMDVGQLMTAMRDWAQGTPLEQRAAAAAVCEPRLLAEAGHARAALQLLDEITAGIAQITDRRSEAFRVLRKGLGYCWSVAVAALPDEGRPLMEKWLLVSDADIAWIMQQNLKKARLERMDATWVRRWQGQT
jgi:hypothetical protein